MRSGSIKYLHVIQILHDKVRSQISAVILESMEGKTCQIQF
jgi:hypothetical protein